MTQKMTEAIDYEQFPDLDAPQHEILSRLAKGLSETEIAILERALKIPLDDDAAASKRPCGTQVALILKGLGVDTATLIAAILSDTRLQDRLGLDEITRLFDPTTANLVKNVRWLNTFNVYSRDIISNPNQAEILRRMLLAMVDDVRAVLIKLAFRVERLRKLSAEDYDLRRYIAQETLELYARLANRLGIRQLKWELEDLAFRYLNPQIYKKIAASLAENRALRVSYLDQFVALLKARLHDEGIDAKVYGRPKHIYSIWKKMQRKQVDIQQVYDLRAVRVIVDKVSTCYATLGVIHGLWQNVPQEFDDYIANPKTNGYQSLHTVVLGPEGALVEIQIRTLGMDQFAEFGVAAHWQYKEGGGHNQAAAQSLDSLRRLLEDRDDDNDLLDNFKTDLYTDRIFVLTPTGEIKELPRGATPLDFAYSVHTEVGHRCRGAKVDHRIVPLSYTLQSGEQVEILTTRDGAPSRSWLDPRLGYLKTSNARGKVRHWFRKQDHERNLRDGKFILDKQRQASGIKEIDRNALVEQFRLSSFDELLIAIGRADISPEQVHDAITPQESRLDRLEDLAARKSRPRHGNSDVQVHGVDNLLTHFARCCKPVFGDPIIGFISAGRGLVVHRQHCKNLLHLRLSKQERLIPVEWGDQPKAQAVDVVIRAIDRTGLLKDITQILSNEQINILEASTRSNHKDHTVRIELTLELLDTAQLNRILERIDQLPHVVESGRKSDV